MVSTEELQELLLQCSREQQKRNAWDIPDVHREQREVTVAPWRRENKPIKLAKMEKRTGRRGRVTRETKPKSKPTE